MLIQVGATDDTITRRVPEGHDSGGSNQRAEWFATRFSGGPVPVRQTIRATFILAVVRALASQGVPERHQELPLLVPQGEPRAFQAADKGEASGARNSGFWSKHSRKR
jgi:hypothetical protein